MKEYSVPPMWPHNCPVNGPTETEAGEPCPWCDAQAPEVALWPNDDGEMLRKQVTP